MIKQTLNQPPRRAGSACIAGLKNQGRGESGSWINSLVCKPAALLPTSIQTRNLEISDRFKGKPLRNWKNKIKIYMFKHLYTLSL